MTSRSKPKAMPACLWHRGEGCEEVLVERVALAIDPLLLVHLDLEAAALLGRVGQLAEGVGELDPAGIELEPLGDARIAGLGSGESGLRDRILAEDGGAAEPEAGLDALDQDAGEDVGPAVVGCDADAGLAGGGGEALTVGCAALVDGSEEVDAGKAGERFRHRQPLGRGLRVDGLGAKRERVGLDCFGGQRQKLGAVVHQGFVGSSRSVPFEQRELRMMEGAALAIAEDASEGEDALLACRQQLLAGELGGGVEVELSLRASIGAEPLGGEGVKMGLVSRRDLQDRRFDLDEILLLEELPESTEDPPAIHKEGASVSVDGG